MRVRTHERVYAVDEVPIDLPTRFFDGHSTCMYIYTAVLFPLS